MRYAYPAILHHDGGGGFLVAFPDVPEALTGASTLLETLALAEHALATALAGYVHAGRAIPAPSALKRGERLIPVPPTAAARLALYTAMRAEGLTKAALAERLGVSETAVRKLLDPDRRSYLGHVETALRVLGRTLIVEDVNI